MEQPLNNGYTPQQTQAWFDARMAKFTSSEIWKLMGVKSLTPDAPLSETAKTWVIKKFKELTTGYADEIKASALEWGKTTEPLAKQELVNRHQVRMRESEFIQHPTMFYFGGSPDGSMDINGLKHTVEIKCPYDTAEHYKNILLSTDAATMRKEYPELYWQMQSNMYLQDTKIAIFVTYDHRIKVNPENIYFEAYLERNDADIALMLMQLEKAWKYYQEIGFSFNVDVAEYLTPKATAA